MSLSRFALALKPAARAGAAIAILALSGLGLATSSPEAVVALRFAEALKTPPQQTASAGIDRALVAGTEAYWLAEKRRHETDGGAIEPATWSTPITAGLSVGDRITISSGKSERNLQVVAVAEVEPVTAATGDAGPAVRQIAVTCRDLGSPDAHLTTFITPLVTAPTAPKAGRSL